MGQAYHRKRIPLGRGTKTRGVGIRYTLVMPPAPRELTAEDIVAREVERQKQVALEEGRRLREWNISVLLNVGQQIMQSWQKAVHANYERLINFSGWCTTENVCAFPPDDEGVAAVYVLAVNQYVKLTGNPSLSVEDRDMIYAFCFNSERKFPLEEVAQEALELLRTAAEKCCDREGVDAQQLEYILTKRAWKSQSSVAQRTNLDSALIFLDAKLVVMFDVLFDGDGREDFDKELAAPQPSATPLMWRRVTAADLP